MPFIRSYGVSFCRKFKHGRDDQIDIIHQTIVGGTLDGRPDDYIGKDRMYGCTFSGIKEIPTILCIRVHQAPGRSRRSQTRLTFVPYNRHTAARAGIRPSFGSRLQFHHTSTQPVSLIQFVNLNTYRTPLPEYECRILWL
ncbi:unnamed protein product, partial [Rhizoctonia solani]